MRCYVRPTTCGRLAVENGVRAFWQSRAGLRDAPVLTDLQQLARQVRAWPIPSNPSATKSRD